MIDSKKGTRLTLAGLAAVSVLGACTPPPADGSLNDPYETTNRRVHDFNVGLDRALLRPAGNAANALPPELTDRVVRFSDNVALPGMVLNGLLQGDIGGAATNSMRFILNTTVGIGGLFDPSGAIGLHESSTDFGETLAVWGVPEGAFIELPVLGPSTERDAFGRLVDLFIDPLAKYGTQTQLDYGTEATIAGYVFQRGRFGTTIDSLLYDSADSYAQTRLLYLQNRRFELGIEAGTGAADPYGDSFADPYATTPGAFADPYGDQ